MTFSRTGIGIRRVSTGEPGRQGFFGRFRKICRTGYPRRRPRVLQQIKRGRLLNFVRCHSDRCHRSNEPYLASSVTRILPDPKLKASISGPSPLDLERAIVRMQFPSVFLLLRHLVQRKPFHPFGRIVAVEKDANDFVRRRPFGDEERFVPRSRDDVRVVYFDQSAFPRLQSEFGISSRMTRLEDGRAGFFIEGQNGPDSRRSHRHFHRQIKQVRISMPHAKFFQKRRHHLSTSRLVGDPQSFVLYVRPKAFRIDFDRRLEDKNERKN